MEKGKTSNFKDKCKYGKNGMQSKTYLDRIKDIEIAIGRTQDTT